MRRKEQSANALRHLLNIILIIFAVVGLGCSATDLHAGEIASYEECIEAGYPMMKSMPPRCSTGDGRVFVRGLATPHYIESLQRGSVDEAVSQKAASQKACRDMCGNGRCEEIVCEAVGCPCAETPTSCPDDCSR